MRRKDKEITGKDELLAVIRNAEVCSLALSDKGEPYVVPINFGFSDDTFYFHCAKEGRKLDILADNSKVCLMFYSESKIIDGGRQACDWGSDYKSVIAVGTGRFLEDVLEKRAGLEAIMAHYSGASHTFSEEELSRVGIIRVDITEMTGKKAGY